MSEAALRREVEQTLEFYERQIGRVATRARRMIQSYGEIEALSHLVTSAYLQQGFRVLRDSGHLDKTFEAVVVRFKHLFRSDVVAAAKWRLEHPYELF
jgi:hypothetical protein